MHALTEQNDCYFRQFSQDSYTRLRTLAQLVDGVALDFKNYEFHPREMIAALMYLVLGRTMMVFPDYYQMAVEFSQNSPIQSVENHARINEQI